MRRFRNPRFAPESLERKLSPTSLVPITVPVTIHVTAEVFVHASSHVVSGSSHVVSGHGSGHMTACDEPSGGTDPDPGDGDGSPPPTPPSIPTGPPVPGGN